MLAVVFSIATLLEMSRHYAHARGTTDAQGDTLESTVTSIASIVNDKSTTIQEKLRAILRIELDYVRSDLASKGAAVSKQASAELCALAWAAITTFGWGLICVVWFVFA